MRHKKLKQRLKNKEAARKAARGMADHYKELSEVSLGELRHEKMNVEYLLSVLDEIHAMTDDELTKAVIENAKNRHNLDKIIHARDIFSYS